MSTFMRIGPDLNSLMNEEPAAMTEEQVNEGLSDNGETGTRTASIQFGADGEVVAASNKGLMTAQANAPRDNSVDLRLSFLNTQNEQLIRAAEKLEDGTPEKNALLSKMAALEEQAQQVVEDGARSEAAYAVEKLEAGDRTNNSLAEELAEQEAAAEKAAANKVRKILF
jgi:hypothetical protein